MYGTSIKVDNRSFDVSINGNFRYDTSSQHYFWLYTRIYPSHYVSSVTRAVNRSKKCAIELKSVLAKKTIDFCFVFFDSDIDWIVPLITIASNKISFRRRPNRTKTSLRCQPNRKKNGFRMSIASNQPVSACRLSPTNRLPRSIESNESASENVNWNTRTGFRK